MSKRCKLQKEYYKQYGNYKGNGKYCDKYVSWLEEQILALRIQDVAGQSEQLCNHKRVIKSRLRKEDGKSKYCKDCQEWLT